MSDLFMGLLNMGKILDVFKPLFYDMPKAMQIYGWCHQGKEYVESATGIKYIKEFESEEQNANNDCQYFNKRNGAENSGFNGTIYCKYCLHYFTDDRNG